MNLGPEQTQTIINIIRGWEGSDSGSLPEWNRPVGTMEPKRIGRPRLDLSRSSSTEDRIRVPFFLGSLF